MRPFAFCAAAVVLALSARSASANAGRASWGISPSETTTAASAAGEVVLEEACPVPFSAAEHQQLLATGTQQSGVELLHIYWFSRDGLALVATTVTKLPAGVTQEAYCDTQKAALTATYGEPRQTDGMQGFDWTFESAAQPDAVRLHRGDSGCETWRSSRAFAATKYASNTTSERCFAPVELGDSRGNQLSAGSTGTCTATDKSLFAARPLRIEKQTDLHFDLHIGKPGALRVLTATGTLLADVETTDEPKLGDVARARLTLAPGCYMVEVGTKGAKVSSYYRLITEPYADWKRDDELWREEQIGEEGDRGPPTAYYPAIIMGEPPDLGGRVHLHASAAIALVDAANLYGMHTSLGVEVTRHRRARAIVGGSASIMFQPMGDAFSTSNTMFPFSLWGGVRATATKRIAATARAGVLGYHITADADEMVLGAIDRSESGGGYLLGLDVTFGSALLGVERWILAEGVTSFRLGFGF